MTVVLADPQNGEDDRSTASHRFKWISGVVGD
jgi:hypothetical protein